MEKMDPSSTSSIADPEKKTEIFEKEIRDPTTRDSRFTEGEDVIEKAGADSTDDEKGPKVVEKPLQDAQPPPPNMSKIQMFKAYRAAKKRAAAADKDKKKEGGAVKNFLRILTFGKRLDYFLMGMCCITAIGSGVAMPLMFVVFGRLVGNFTGYFTPGSSVSEDQFHHQIVQNTLYMVYIGSARFALSFISLVSTCDTRMTGLTWIVLRSYVWYSHLCQSSACLHASTL
jgi:hypothetical protein